MVKFQEVQEDVGKIHVDVNNNLQLIENKILQAREIFITLLILNIF